MPTRVWSPVPGGSTLITSAPMSPSTCPQNGPAITWQSSTTRTPSSAPVTRLRSLQRGADAVADVVAGELQAHLHAAQRAREHQVVEVAEMADPEHLVLQLAEPRAERHVEALEDDAAQLVRAVEHDRGQRAGELALVERQHLEAPAVHGGAGRRGVAGVAGEDVLQAFLAQQDLQRLAQPVEQVGGARVRPVAGLVGGDDRRPVPVRARQLRGLGRSSAFSETALKLSPAGSIRPFWLPPTVTSTPHSSCR